MHFKKLSGKWRAFCPCHNMLIVRGSGKLYSISDNEIYQINVHHIEIGIIIYSIAIIYSVTSLILCLLSVTGSFFSLHPSVPGIN